MAVSRFAAGRIPAPAQEVPDTAHGRGHNRPGRRQGLDQRDRRSLVQGTEDHGVEAAVDAGEIEPPAGEMRPARWEDVFR